MKIIYVKQVSDKQLKQLIAKGYAVIVKGCDSVAKVLNDHVL